MTVAFRSAPDPSRGPRWRTGAGAAVVLVLAALAVTIAVSALSTAQGAGSTTVTSAPSADASSWAATSEPSSVGGVLFVHVHGAVVSPGLYELAAGARVVDVIAAAGGFGDEADPAGVNLARPLVDGEQLKVPAVGEVVADSGADGGGAVGGGAVDGGGGAAGGGGAGSLVNLNTADDAALQTLPGVGPATAGAILDWRQQNGTFRSVDDLLGVSGIGEKTLEKLRPQVTV